LNDGIITVVYIRPFIYGYNILAAVQTDTRVLLEQKYGNPIIYPVFNKIICKQ
jgi:hypothetical protein